VNTKLAPLTEAIIPIWERVLGRSQIGVDDNFFDLGGNLSTARELFGEIAKVCGRELPPETILRAPTIASLAGLLERTYSPRLPCLIRMRSGAEQPAVFITHGIGSNVLELSPLLDHIQTDRAIYGLQARGSDGVDEPHERIEDMAEYFLNAVREKQPLGPYLLIGYSMGGMVALEMAQRLCATGEKVDLLAMIESFPDRPFLPMNQLLGIYVRLLKKHLSNAKQLPFRDALSYIFRPSYRTEFMFRNRPGASSLRRPDHLNKAMERMLTAGYKALAHYRPHPYPGKINFVQAEISVDFPDDAIAVWSDLAAELVVETAPGDHQGVITAHSDFLGSVLSRYLHEALCQK
jgi:thioesterase domain-containing protein